MDKKQTEKIETTETEQNVTKIIEEDQTNIDENVEEDNSDTAESSGTLESKEKCQQPICIMV